MSGHSKWSTIKRKKAVTDAKRGQIFTRVAKEISIASRDGGDMDINFKLRLAVERARAVNMPKENIERAIKRGTGEDKTGNVFEEVTYEGYLQHGVALIVETLTDNRNRAVADLRHVLNRVGGNLGESGSVAWQFERNAYFGFASQGHSEDNLFDLAVEAGAHDIQYSDDLVEIFAPVEAFKAVFDALEEVGIVPDEAMLRMEPKNLLDLSPNDTLQVMLTIDKIEELDDVQDVYSNLSVSESAISALDNR